MNVDPLSKALFNLFLTTDLILFFYFILQTKSHFLTIKNRFDFSFTNLKSIIFSFIKADLIFFLTKYFFYILLNNRFDFHK